MIEPSYIPAFAALAGAALGGFTSFASSWTTLRVQMKAQERSSSRSRRQKLYKQFIEQASQIYGDALVNNTLELHGLIGLYALISRMRVISSKAVIDTASSVALTITTTYDQPNKTPAELEVMIRNGGVDLLQGFSDACREEFEMEHFALASR